MSARMSFSENTAAKRSVGLACAQAGKAAVAASAAPALSAARRLMRKSMSFPPNGTRLCSDGGPEPDFRALSELVHHPERAHADPLPVDVGGRRERLGQARRARRTEPRA